MYTSTLMLRVVASKVAVAFKSVDCVAALEHELVKVAHVSSLETSDRNCNFWFRYVLVV